MFTLYHRSHSRAQEQVLFSHTIGLCGSLHYYIKNRPTALPTPRALEGAAVRWTFEPILGRPARHEVQHDLLEGGVGLGREGALLGDPGEQVLLGDADVRQEVLLELGDLGRVDLVQVSAHAAVDDGHLLLDGHRHCTTDTESVNTIPQYELQRREHNTKLKFIPVF